MKPKAGYRSLSDPSICEIDPDAELPVWAMAEQRDELGNAVYRLAQQDMLKAGYKKMVK